MNNKTAAAAMSGQRQTKKKQISAIEIYDISQTQGQIISLRG